MKIGAFQFAGSGDMEYNFAKISEGIRQAAGADVRFGAAAAMESMISMA
ncbi:MULTISPECIES: hypothetical protein [Eisenbergiella]|nr:MULTISPECIES: hypothetical protein [Eisenbergiella]MDY2651827.1 hypothetical protein [Eisenbergiella porci]